MIATARYNYSEGIAENLVAGKLIKCNKNILFYYTKIQSQVVIVF